ncbi:MAG: type II toxin-antitoxin system VapC family toxin [Salinarimonas sp.]
MILLDTHASVWALGDNPALRSSARRMIEAASVVYVSAISFFEIGQKARLGKWPEMVPYVESLPSLLARQGGTSVPITAQIASRATCLAWEHRDPFDRILAATALELDVVIVSADRAFDGFEAAGKRISRVW